MKYGNRTRAEGAIHPRPERRGFSRIQVNRLWIDLMETDKDEPTIEDWRQVCADLGYRPGTDESRAAKKLFQS